MTSVDELKTGAAAMTPWQRHRFLVMIGGVVLIAIFLVSISLSLYNNSGAAQLDLSRPDYQAVRNQAKRDTTSVAYPSTGTLDEAAFQKFKTMYDERMGKVLHVDSFDQKALDEESLQLLVPQNSTPEQ